MKKADKDMMPAAVVRQSETHPLEPFVPDGARVLMLGSFPPKKEKWSMDFYYPNRQNDMWRIMGYVFYGDKERFLRPDGKGFDEAAIRRFCAEKGIALSDTAHRVIRLNDNASDKFLEVVEPVDLAALTGRMPELTAVVTTGQKATDTLLTIIGGAAPGVGDSVDFVFGGRALKFYRMPSSSRAYPMAVENKAEYYRRMFSEIGIL